MNLSFSSILKSMDQAKVKNKAESPESDYVIPTEGSEGRLQELKKKIARIKKKKEKDCKNLKKRFLLQMTFLS